jgi:ribosome-binding factor A
MAGPTRQQRLESLLHREIATVIQRDLRDPRLGFLTITRAVMTADLHEITAYYTVLGDATQRRTAARALADAVGYVQRAYAPVVRTRLLPKLRFEYDDKENRRVEMEELIRKARASDPDEGASVPDQGAVEPDGGTGAPPA